MLREDAISLRTAVQRHIPVRVRVIQFMLYFAVLVCTIMGSMFGPLWLIPSLGTLFLSWYFMGEARVHYEYRLDGYQFIVMRTSGMRSRQKEVEFLKLDLHSLDIAADEGVDILKDAQARFAQARPKGITYDVSAHDPDRGCAVMYAMGTGPEQSRRVRVYFQPSPALTDALRKLCPGKVRIADDF